MPSAFINRIATSVPDNDVHLGFIDYACRQLISDERNSKLFRRLSEMGGIEHRYSYFKPNPDTSSDAIDVDGVYTMGSFPSTGTRMKLFEEWAPRLAKKAVSQLDLGGDLTKVTHLVVTCCTGMSAPGIDLQIAQSCGLSDNIERTMVGFMGCYAAMNGFKLARHIVRSEPESKVLVLNIELSTLHLKESTDLEQILSFFLFADGCAASLVTSEPYGISMDSFHAVLAPETEALITWNIRDSGFDMLLSGQVPGAIRDTLRQKTCEILKGTSIPEIDLWAVHPGGRSVLDAVQLALDIPDECLAPSREVLRQYGNMSSPTVVFVMKSMLESIEDGQQGCGMAFGPGLVAETMRFHMVG